MTEVKWGLLAMTAAVIAVAFALYRQHALKRGGLALIVLSSGAIAAAMWLA